MTKHTTAYSDKGIFQYKNLALGECLITWATLITYIKSSEETEIIKLHIAIAKNVHRKIMEGNKALS